MLDKLFYRFNQFRKDQYFNNPLFSTCQQYACVGIGMHSLSVLYPVLKHFNIRPKYCCTANTDRSEAIAKIFPGTISTRDPQDILHDTEVTGVFLCASAGAHFGLLRQFLAAGKKVFVEKPPCLSLQDLSSLVEISTGATCIVGLQRRYWKGNKQILRRVKSTSSYIYRFAFGPYPQGNVFYDLFIHAADYCHFLFGACSILSQHQRKEREGLTIQLQVLHDNGISGLIELSTAHSWSEPLEEMTIRTTDEYLEVHYPIELTGTRKPKRVFGIPAERLLSSPTLIKKYFTAGSQIVPAWDHNTIVMQGFYEELATFIQLVESGTGSAPVNDLPGLRPVYQILDQLEHFTSPDGSRVTG
jgi:virulence factor